MATKIRRNGEPSNSLPTVNAPHWAVNSEFRNASSFTGMLLYIIIVMYIAGPVIKPCSILQVLLKTFKIEKKVS